MQDLVLRKIDAQGQFSDRVIGRCQQAGNRGRVKFTTIRPALARPDPDFVNRIKLHSLNPILLLVVLKHNGR